MLVSEVVGKNAAAVSSIGSPLGKLASEICEPDRLIPHAKKTTRKDPNLTCLYYDNLNSKRFRRHSVLYCVGNPFLFDGR